MSMAPFLRKRTNELRQVYTERIAREILISDNTKLTTMATKPKPKKKPTALDGFFRAIQDDLFAIRFVDGVNS